MHMANWRSPAEYLAHQRYDRAGFAWEIIRRNDDYWRDYQQVGRSTPPDAAATARFARRWGLCFGADPQLDIDRQPVFWLPQVLPTVLQVQPARPDLAFAPIDPAPVFADPDTRLDRAGDALILDRGGARHRLWFDGPEAGALAVVLPLDRTFEHRLAAALRFWRALRRLPPGAEPMPLSRFARDRLILVLRLIDAQHSDATEQEMARVLPNASSKTSRAWRDGGNRSQLRRILRRARDLLEGGYLRLLNPTPRRPPRDRT